MRNHRHIVFSAAKTGSVFLSSLRQPLVKGLGILDQDRRRQLARGAPGCASLMPAIAGVGALAPGEICRYRHAMPRGREALSAS